MAQWTSCAETSAPSTTSRRPPPTKPSAANQAAFDEAVREVAHATQHLLDALVTTAPPKDREEEAAKARARSAERYART